MRAIAVDWSGRASNAASFIWLAEVRNGRVTRLEGGRDRAELIDELLDEAKADPDLIVGLDFAFSFPEWFVQRQGAASAREFWEVVAARGERWLANVRWPFAVTASKLPVSKPLYRESERIVASLTVPLRPRSVFALYGHGQVGPGSLRGIPLLLRLSERFNIWPFDRASTPLAVEIWPRLFAVNVNRSSRRARLQHLQKIGGVGKPLIGVAASNEDVFDATISALALFRDARRVLGQPQLPRRLLEGEIWH